MSEQVKNNEITIGFLWTVARRRLVWLILALVVGAGMALAYTKLMVSPVYSSRAQFSVENIYNSPSMGSNSYQSGAAQMAAGYAHEITGNVFLGEVLRVYNLRHADKALTLSAISSMVSVSTQEELPVFNVKVASTDRQVAYDVLQIIEELAPGFLLNEGTAQYINIKLIEYGYLAASPDSPNVVLNVVIGGVVVLIVTYVAFFLSAFLDKTVYSEEGLKSVSKLPIVGQIPQWVKRSEMGKKRLHDANIDAPERRTGSIQRDYEERLLSDKTPFSVVEAFKALRTNLTYVPYDGNGAPVFGVTSGYAGAGKSVVIANVAISFAQLGKRVLLIDGDMRCPTQHKIFGVDGHSRGLSEVLAGIETNIFEVAVSKTSYHGLELMTCGHIPPNPSELLSSDRMKSFLELCRAQYDYVFIDLPPILETSDAGVLTPCLTAYLLVVRAGYSKIDNVCEVVDVMESMHANLAGFVLNDVSVRGGSYGYYSPYSKYQRYGKYARVEGPRPKNTELETPAEKG